MSFNIGVLIALKVEFSDFLAEIEASDHWESKSKPTMFLEEDLCFWKVDLKPKNANVGGDRKTVQIVAALVGEMGPEHTAMMSRIIIEK